ncbi:MAG TPA: TonB-dependent receptor plug domain-containing protein [Terriglobales bacterium]|nr:TonB-dependent receptor plug domain-containing protein [Terriglobales bacterium]
MARKFLWRASASLAIYLGATLSLSLFTFAQHTVSIHGTVRDPLGAVISGAHIELLQQQKAIASANTDDQGNYNLPAPTAGRYQLRVSASSFKTIVTDSAYLSASGETPMNITLSPGQIAQQITVTANGTPTPEAQVGAAVSVLNKNQFPLALDVQQPMRLVTGLQIAQTGQLGGTSALYIRGGNSDANKVLIDGLPADFVGGFAEFATLPAAGVDEVEVLRSPNSALYGSDALAGVVSLTTAHGTTPLPLFTYAADGGNFGTYHQEGSVGGAVRQFDYFSDFSGIYTRGNLPRDAFHNATYAGNFGWTPLANTSLRLTVRHINNSVDLPNAIQLYGIPDAEGQTDSNTYIGLTLENQTTDRWHNLLRYGRVRLNEVFTDYAPTGIPADCFAEGFTSCYLGNPVTIQGANGYSVSGQAIFQFAGTYPSQTRNTTNRDFIYAQSDYRLNSHTVALFGFKYENERGREFSTGFTNFPINRGNYSYTAQVAGDLYNRLYYTLGTGIENNELFGVKATPRASLAYYLLRPGSSGVFTGTKVRASVGTGIKEPSIPQQSSSLFNLLETNGQTPLIQQFGISPVGAQRSRTYDGGVDQFFGGGKGKLSVSYFHSEFTDVVEFVPEQGLLDFGIPLAVASEAQFGAYVNSQAFRSMGIETEVEYKLASHLMARGGYTYLDAVIQKSFSSDALAPTINPSFPNIPIGAFSPLVGARPFRRAPHSGYFQLIYSHPRWFASLSGTFVGKRDESDFLSDQFFGGPSLLLPNRNLDAAYQRFDLSGSYRLTHYAELYSSAQNLFSQHYSETFGFPSLPLTFRAGMKFSFGGESWKLKK